MYKLRICNTSVILTIVSLGNVKNIKRSLEKCVIWATENNLRIEQYCCCLNIQIKSYFSQSIFFDNCRFNC